jgi:hypothetical protein
MIKYENSTSKIYIRNIKDYTDIDPTVDFVFPVNKIDCGNSEKKIKTNLKLTKCVFRSLNISTISNRITGNFCGFGLKRRHLIFADFFSCRFKISAPKKKFVLQEAMLQ